MTALDRNDRIPDDAPQNKVKLEWITPKISLMKAGDTDQWITGHTVTELRS
jgi:hypothetical protein